VNKQITYVKTMHRVADYTGCWHC